MPRLIDQMLSYRWADNTSPDGSSKKERVIKTADDLSDPVRYATMTWPELPIAAKTPEGRDYAEFPEEQRWAMERMARINKRERGDETGDEDIPGMMQPAEGEAGVQNFF